DRRRLPRRRRRRAGGCFLDNRPVRRRDGLFLAAIWIVHDGENSAVAVSSNAGLAALQVEEGALAVQTPCISDESTARADDAVAWQDDRDRVLVERPAHRSRGARP